LTDTDPPPRTAFGHRAFLMFWVGRIVSILAFHVLMVAIGWQLYSLTGSAFDLGLLGIAQFVPMLAFTLFIGHAADRYDNRLILFVCQIVEALAAAIMVLGTAMGWLSPVVIFVIMVLIGAARAFEIPTMVALIPSLVPRPVVPSATAWFVSSNQIGQIVGPVLGGVLYGGLGPEAVYGVAILLWGIGAAFIFMIRMEHVPRAREQVSVTSLLGGFHFVWKDPVILGTISLDLCVVFVGAATGMFPVFARDILQAGPWGLGLLRAAPGVGAVIMSVMLAHWPLKLPVGPVLFSVIATFGFSILVFALSTHLILSLVALAVMGAADVISVVIRFSLVQLRTPVEMRGRVSAVNSMFTGTSNYLGDFRAGSMAALLGAVPAVALGGASVLLVTALWMVLFPQMVRIRSFEELPQAPVLGGQPGSKTPA
jgi:MFS family permease